MASHQLHCALLFVWHVLMCQLLRCFHIGISLPFADFFLVIIIYCIINLFKRDSHRQQQKQWQKKNSSSTRFSAFWAWFSLAWVLVFPPSLVTYSLLFFFIFTVVTFLWLEFFPFLFLIASLFSIATLRCVVDRLMYPFNLFFCAAHWWWCTCTQWFRRIPSTISHRLLPSYSDHGHVNEPSPLIDCVWCVCVCVWATRTVYHRHRFSCHSDCADSFFRFFLLRVGCVCTRQYTSSSVLVSAAK